MSACACSALAVCSIITLHHHDCFIASSSAVCAKPVFPSRHPVLPVVLMNLSRFLPENGCQAAHLFLGWDLMLPHNIPSRFGQQSFTRLPDFSPTGGACSMEQH